MTFHQLDQLREKNLLFLKLHQQKVEEDHPFRQFFLQLHLFHPSFLPLLLPPMQGKGILKCITLTLIDMLLPSPLSPPSPMTPLDQILLAPSSLLLHPHTKHLLLPTLFLLRESSHNLCLLSIVSIPMLPSRIDPLSVSIKNQPCLCLHSSLGIMSQETLHSNLMLLLLDHVINLLTNFFCVFLCFFYFFFPSHVVLFA